MKFSVYNQIQSETLFSYSIDGTRVEYPSVPFKNNSTNLKLTS